jgi:hypothetical protein
MLYMLLVVVENGYGLSLMTGRRLPIDDNHGNMVTNP